MNGPIVAIAPSSTRTRRVRGFPVPRSSAWWTAIVRHPTPMASQRPGT